MGEATDKTPDHWNRGFWMPPDPKPRWDALREAPTRTIPTKAVQSNTTALNRSKDAA
mgnify:CR=1 FL=1